MNSSKDTNSTFIRMIKPSDVKELYALGLLCFDWEVERAIWNLRVIEHFATFHYKTSFCAVADGVLLGLSLAYPTQKSGYLAWLAVAPNWRGRPIARELMNVTIKCLEAYPIERIYGLARQDLVTLFHAWGFEQTNEIKVGMFREVKKSACFSYDSI